MFIWELNLHKHFMPRKIPLLSSKNKGIILLILGATIGFLGGAMFTIGWEARQNTIKALNGELNPFPIDLSKLFVVSLSKIGGPVTDKSFNSTELANGINLRQIFPADFTTNQLKVEFVNNKLSVSADIKNSNGTRIAQIVNNEWKTVDPNTLLFWDRNYNAYAFEIIGSNNVPTFQVIMRDSNRIQIGGLFYTEHGRIYFEPRADGALLYVNYTDSQLEDAHIPTAFKYPALTDPSNLGRMNDSFYPSSDPLSESTWTMVFGAALAITGPILFAFGFEKCKESSKKAKLRGEISNRNTIRQGNPHYRLRRKEKYKKKSHSGK
jgi:hypothetical protein